MYFQFGTYKHVSNEVSLTIAPVRPLFNKREERFADEVTFKIDGFMQSADGTVATLTKQLAALEAAYAFDYKDAGLYNDDGSILSPRHYLKNSQTIDGVRVIRGVEYPQGKGAEYSTYRYYAIELQAKIKRNNYSLLEFTESLTITGTGGPRFVIVETRNGKPRKQQTSQYTKVHAVQSGHAVGQYSRPVPPPPLFPGDEHEDQRNIKPDDPKRIGENLFEWPISWTYVFESAGPLNGQPNVPPLSAG